VLFWPEKGFEVNDLELAGYGVLLYQPREMDSDEARGMVGENPCWAILEVKKLGNLAVPRSRCHSR
jgi:hypothetical protein